MRLRACSELAITPRQAIFFFAGQHPESGHQTGYGDRTRHWQMPCQLALLQSEP
jgi:hypothetical protein